MITFPLNENQFSFFVADHLLVGQFCTNPKSDSSLLSCQKVTQCSMSEIGDAPLSNPYSLSIQVMTTGPLPAPSKCKSEWFNTWGHSSTHWTTLWRWSSRRPHQATSHFWSRFESQHQSIPGCAEECGDPLVQSGGRWQTLGVTAGLGAGSQVQRDPGVASLTGPLLPWPERREHHQHGCPRGVMVKAMNCGIVVREFVLQPRYYVHFRANTLGKSMNPLILPPAMGK